ncbi:type II toxin-antitoxin system RelE/ParE family toxin [Kitasatospora sp. NPDC008115]|uniref:type II toxin-antitoxin system RelE/ParE family toxin n=1 Tax=Kitasatospora sp. NPDC008115 TaxID=3364022 RepID=UPI0036ED2E2E
MTGPASGGFRLVILDEVKEVLHELRSTDRKTLDCVTEAITALRREGPGLSRPLAARIGGSRLNLRELRPRSGNAMAMRILYIFDLERRVVLLVAGNKAGDWNRWYVDAVPLAEERYEQYLKLIEEGA